MKLVIFDFDGVLVNTNELSYQIHKIKNKDLTWKSYQEYSNGNFHEGYEKAVKEGKHLPADDFYGEYEKGLNALTMHDALHNLILSLVKNYRLVVVSSTNSSYIKDFLAKENLSEYFTDILGADVHRSKVFKIKTILKKYKLSPEESVFITDTLGDIKEAKECNVESIGVSWGLHEKKNLLKENPFVVVDIPEELEEKIEEFFK
ncbi:TPA: hypothetical protein DEQ22_01975 [Candidatus Nomurabacteria bacterium]|uniref:FCP1 homology domain-containing protein n=2 Tax=Candidatus Nomuraibacteriota TaxID=1752729 RepID=A0A1F6YPP8_9BACT|nr:MAG: putative phosphatase [Parcubacteria group bacterium GW2011_GWC1_42_21]KKS58154.1 MAG: putative phosphatase [Candidatus Nomurabacteria bacterium GW2011_GWF1_42_40]KKT00489.1 MAG: putative phosphatase [Candidatus Nomurabacteria bacterium GW2011_GWA1_43_17]KKT07833.1 MAG: putative phosphatase [Candidatus Nomurabacteria bacterium GW2011_GWB1_43_19]KKT11402.1 MAG: putative phosphatase [Candidatus Nomurabacteria bacterium GW2011_GWF2_43_24]KKT18040.1 MAG: putative phosphatase [Candidatus Nom